MVAKQLKTGRQARRSIQRGIDQLADAVRITLGPKGRNVVFAHPWGLPTITNDGVTIAKEVELRKPWENLGARLAREVAAKTNDAAGDGTTTATVLAQAMVREGMRQVTAGANPVELRAGIGDAVQAAIDSILDQARPVAVDDRDAIAYVAENSAQDTSVGQAIAAAMAKVGADGAVTVEDGQTFGIELEFTEGMQFDKGYLSPYFITDPDGPAAVLDDASVLITDRKVTALPDTVPLLEKIMEADRPLLVIAEDITGDALATLVVNKIRGVVDVVAVKAPGFGDRRKAMLADFATLTGAQVISPELGLKLENATLDQLGRARRVVVTKDDTTIIEGGGDPGEIAARIDQIRHEMRDTTSEWDRKKLAERLAKLKGGVAVIKVGAATDVEVKERKHRLEDAVQATKAAVEESIVAGGGVALLRAQQAIDRLEGGSQDVALGRAVVRRALEAPMRQIADNAGWDGATVVERVRDLGGTKGFNALTGQYEDLLDAGIIDPAKVVRSAIQNAGSVAGLVVTTEALVTEKPQRRRPAAAPNGFDEDYED